MGIKDIARPNLYLHLFAAPHTHCFMNVYTKTIALNHEEQTVALGKRLSPFLRAGDILTLRGELGAGKTSFSRGLISSLAGDVEVPSPTYTMVQTYSSASFEIWHFDLYRLENETHIWELGIEEAFDDGVCLIEWPERIENLLSGSELNIKIQFDKSGRIVTISGSQVWGERLAKF